MRDLMDALYRHGAEAPRRPFLLICENRAWQQFSYADAIQETERWAARWTALNLPAGSVVCIAMPHAPELYFLFLGAMRAGLVPAFLAFPTPKQDAKVYWDGLGALLARTRPGCIVVAPEQRAIVSRIAPPGCVTLDRGTLGALPERPIPPLDQAGRAGQAVALLQHSSGTTGAKKGVCLTFEQIRMQAAALSAALAITHRDRIVSWLPLYHDMGLMTGFLLPLTAGACVVSLDAFEWLAQPSLFLDAIGLVQGTLAWLPNFAFAHLVRVRDPGETFALQSMRAFVSCSEPCKAETARAFAAAFATSGVRPAMLTTCYAMAETVFATTQSPVGTPPTVITLLRRPLEQHDAVVLAQPGAETSATIDLVSCGRPVDGVSISIRRLDGSAGPVAGAADPPAALVGEILVKSGFLFASYHRNPAATAEALQDGWYRTGDLGFVHEGELFVTGRIKDVVIVHGRNLYVHDIEQAVSEVDGIKPGRVVAFGEFDETSASEAVVVVAETGVDDPVCLAALRRVVRQHVFDRLELTIRRIEFTGPGTLIKTTSGKMSRAENAIRFATDRRRREPAGVHG